MSDASCSGQKRMHQALEMLAIAIIAMFAIDIHRFLAECISFDAR